jgi:hypothetical protein
MDSASTLPVNFNKAVKILEKLESLPKYDFLGYTLNGKLFLGICGIIANTLSTKQHIVDIATIQATLSGYANKVITNRLLLQMYLYVAHNFNELQHNKACPPLKALNEEASYLTCVKIEDIQIIDLIVYINCLSIWGPAYGRKSLYIIKKSADTHIDYLLRESGINNRRNDEGEISDLLNCCFYANMWFNKHTNVEQCSQLHCSEYLKKINKTKYRNQRLAESSM